MPLAYRLVVTGERGGVFDRARFAPQPGRLAWLIRLYFRRNPGEALEL